LNLTDQGHECQRMTDLGHGCQRIVGEVKVSEAGKLGKEVRPHRVQLIVRQAMGTVCNKK
jgi:hypothetical protein